MRDYLYLKITQQEPFDILYLTPSLTMIYNVADKSYSLAPQVLYNPVSNVELKIKSTFIHGKQGSEFGEKPFDYKIECFVKIYF